MCTVQRSPERLGIRGWLPLAVLCFSATWIGPGCKASGGTAISGAGGGGLNGGTGGSAGGSNGSAAGGAGGRTVPPTVSGLFIEANPNNNLSCFVSWTSDTATSSEVQFGAGAYRFHIVADESVTSHRVLVIGMTAQTDYLIKAVSKNAGGSASAEGTFTTGALPSGLPVSTLTVNDTAAAQPGWTLTNIMQASQGVGFNGTAPGIIVMVDQTGVPVWYFVNGTTPDQRGDVSLRVLGNGNLILGPSSGEPAKEIDLAGNVVWSGPPVPAATASKTDPATAPMSHFANKLPNGNYILFRDLTDANGIGGAYVEEVTPTNEVAWSWNLFDHIQPPAGAAKDWCHPNSVTVDLDHDVFYLSCRFQGIIKARRSGDKGVIWVLGGQAGGDFTFSPESANFGDQHDPEIHADGTILFYDNMGSAARPPAGVTTRVLELFIDENTRQARLSFEFPGSFAVDAWYTTNWYTPYWGDADRLANGNILITAGFRSQTEQTHIFEVRPSDGKVVWQITLPAGVGSYQADRLSPPPLVQPL